MPRHTCLAEKWSFQSLLYRTLPSHPGIGYLTFHYCDKDLFFLHNSLRVPKEAHDHFLRVPSSILSQRSNIFLSLYTARPSFEYYRQMYFVHSGLQVGLARLIEISVNRSIYKRKTIIDMKIQKSVTFNGYSVYLFN